MTQGRRRGRRREEKNVPSLMEKSVYKRKRCGNFTHTHTSIPSSNIHWYVSMRLWQIEKEKKNKGERVISVTIEAPADVGEISLFVVGNFHILYYKIVYRLCNPQSPI